MLLHFIFATSVIMCQLNGIAAPVISRIFSRRYWANTGVVDQAVDKNPVEAISFIVYIWRSTNERSIHIQKYAQATKHTHNIEIEKY